MTVTCRYHGIVDVGFRSNVKEQAILIKNEEDIEKISKIFNSSVNAEARIQVLKCLKDGDILGVYKVQTNSATEFAVKNIQQSAEIIHINALVVSFLNRLGHGDCEGKMFLFTLPKEFKGKISISFESKTLNPEDGQSMEFYKSLQQPENSVTPMIPFFQSLALRPIRIHSDFNV